MKSSFGLDQMSNRLVKSLISTIRLPLMTVFNMSLASDSFPKSMKITKVQPLFKSRDCIFYNNYRPISLLPVLSKIIEKIVHQMVVQFFDENNIIAQTQFCFHTKHTKHQLPMSYLGLYRISIMDLRKIIFVCHYSLT